VRKAVRAAARRKNPAEALSAISIESCGKSHILLGGIAEDLHKRNVRFLYKNLSAEETAVVQGNPEA